PGPCSSSCPYLRSQVAAPTGLFSEVRNWLRPRDDSALPFAAPLRLCVDDRPANGEVRVMRKWALAVALGAGCTLAACGSGEPEGKSKAEQSAPRAAAPAATGNATAIQVATEARGKLKCPARPKTPSRAGGAPVDDVVGVRPGMTYDEAVDTVLCTHELLVAG